MDKTSVIEPNDMAKPTAPLSSGHRRQDLVITAGQIGRDASGNLISGIEGQIEAAIHNLRLVLESGGSDLANIIKTNCYLAHPGDFETFNIVYGDMVPEPFPPRTAVCVTFPDPKVRFEIEAIGEVKDDGDNA